MFSSVVVGNLVDVDLFGIVVSVGSFSMMGCSLLASVLLSVFKIVVIGT